MRYSRWKRRQARSRYRPRRITAWKGFRSWQRNCTVRPWRLQWPPAPVALGRMTLARTSVAVPVLPGEWDTALQRAIEAAGLSKRHGLRRVAADDLIETLRPYEDLLTTMGRTLDQDRAFFLATCAAAR